MHSITMSQLSLSNRQYDVIMVNLTPFATNLMSEKTLYNKMHSI